MTADQSVIARLNEYSRSQVMAIMNPRRGPVASALTVLFNGLSYNSPKLIQDAADRLGLELDRKKNPHLSLGKIAQAAEEQGLGETKDIRKLVDLTRSVAGRSRFATRRPAW